ncbi:MAG: wax ester/triacylglycerol synthase domain-containing protein [Acidimicrobiales bacterium]
MNDIPTAGHTDRMSEIDALMWIVERNPHLRSTMTSVATFAGPLDRQLVRQRVDHMSRILPRLRQVVKGNPLSIATPRWEYDTKFDLDYHLRWVGAAGDRQFADVLSLAEPLIMHAFDRERPLWEAIVAEGLADGTSALILKVHHAVADGLGAMRMQMELFDFEPGEIDKGAMPEVPTEVPLDQAERTVDAIAHEFNTQRQAISRGRHFLRNNALHPVGTGKSFIQTTMSATRLLKPADSALSPVMTERSLSVRLDTISLSLSELKAAAKKADGKLNDAFLAAICLGLQSYHQRMGQPVEVLRFGVPVSQRDKDDADKTGNHWAPVRFELEMCADPTSQMKAIQEHMSQARNEPALEWLGSISGSIRRLPQTIATSIVTAAMRGTDVEASNVPGSPVPMYLAGTEMLAQYPFGPTTTAALNVTVLSYQDHLHVGVAMNPAAVTETDAMMDDLRAGFAQVLAN